MSPPKYADGFVKSIFCKEGVAKLSVLSAASNASLGKELGQCGFAQNLSKQQALGGSTGQGAVRGKVGIKKGTVVPPLVPALPQDRHGKKRRHRQAGVKVFSRDVGQLQVVAGHHGDRGGVRFQVKSLEDGEGGHRMQISISHNGMAQALHSILCLNKWE